MDESLDDILRDESAAAPPAYPSMPARLRALLHGQGIKALVVKPAVVGGFERSMMIARWAHAAGVQVMHDIDQDMASIFTRLLHCQMQQACMFAV